MVDAARISARGVAFAYGADIALSDVDLDVLAGDRLVLLGPNGGGKTTLVRLLLGLLRPQRGRVSFVRPPGVLRLGYVPQFPAFDRDFPIRLEEMVAQGLLGARPRRSVGEIRRAVDAALSRLGLERLRAAYLSELSGGETKRALVARALVCEPEVLFLDEPTASLDEASRRAFWERIGELPAETAIVLVTHDLAPGTLVPNRAFLVDRTISPVDLTTLHRHPLLCGHGHD
ncbi:MAG: ATP-binding cassette domain-containing protein [Acidobacteria bacterium]|nr:ATP-binding cassette domain-containing protein [Acidobacteriota bacterium]